MLPLLQVKRSHVDVHRYARTHRIGHQRRITHPADGSGRIQLALEALDASFLERGRH